ncbi:MAG: endonuclease/exonuclease/phosphatase family protein [Candidatus Hodarchaeales archaeon]
MVKKIILIVSSVIILFLVSFNLAILVPNAEIIHQSIKADVDPPVITFRNPTVTNVGDTVTIVFDATDESNITEYELLIDGQYYSNTSVYYWNTDNEAEGEHLITARAKDEVNLWGEKNLTVNVIKDYDTGVVKVLNYNVLESGETNDNGWMDVAKEENPDIIIAAETGSWDDDNNLGLKQAINELNSYFSDEDPYVGYTTPGVNAPTEGVAILSRFPIIMSEKITSGYLDGDQPYDLYREVLHSVVEIGETYVHVIGIHLKCCGGTNEELLREQDMEAIVNFMDSLGSVPIIFAGDFNSFSPEDVGELAPIPGNLGDGPISMLVNKTNPHSSTVHNWVDVFRELNPEDPGYSYIDPFYKSRIDFIFVNDFFFDKLINSTVGDTPSAESGSDHYAVDVFLNFDASTIDLRPPLPPTGLDGTLLSPTSFNLTWNPNTESDFSHYIIYRGEYTLAEVNKTYFVDSSVESGIHYPYKIRAVDENGNVGFLSKELILEPSYGICKKPTAPILSGYPGDGSTTLIWEPTDNGGLPIVEYLVYRRFYNTPDGTVSILKGTVPGTSLGYRDTTNYNGNLAYWVVKAVNIIGESDYSNVVNVTPSAEAEEPPTIPTTTVPTTVSPPPPQDTTTTSSTTTTSQDTTTTTSFDTVPTSGKTSVSLFFILIALPFLARKYKKKR